MENDPNKIEPTAPESNKDATIMELSNKVEALMAENKAYAAKMDAIEQHLAQKETGGLVSTAKEVKPALTGEAFKVGSKSYRAKYPLISIDAKQYTEEAILSDKHLQKRLVEDFPGLLVAL